MECGDTVRKSCGCGKSVMGVPLCNQCFFGSIKVNDYPCNDCSGTLATSKCHFAPKNLGGY